MDQDVDDVCSSVAKQNADKETEPDIVHNKHEYFTFLRVRGEIKVQKQKMKKTNRRTSS